MGGPGSGRRPGGGRGAKSSKKALDKTISQFKKLSPAARASVLFRATGGAYGKLGVGNRHGKNWGKWGK